MENFGNELFLSDISSVDWHSLLRCPTDINVVVEQWINILALIIQMHTTIHDRRVLRAI